jgi:hypothetical protein
LIASIPTAGVLMNTFTTAQSILTTGAQLSASSGFITLMPGFFMERGELHIDAVVNTSWASGNTMIWTVKVGAVAAAVSGTFKVTTTGGTLEPQLLHIVLSCQSTGNGTNAKLMAGGFVAGRMIVPPGGTAGANYAAPSGYSLFQEASAALGTGFDSTIANTLDLHITMGTSSASNGVQLMDYKVRSFGNTAV